MGASYLADTAVYRSGRPLFIDKMPNNFRHIGLIHLILPNAVIIDARREPMACCFSNLKQLFAHGQEFAYGIEPIARYYRTYLDLMAHWDAALPGRILRVHHEDVVADLDDQRPAHPRPLRPAVRAGLRRLPPRPAAASARRVRNRSASRSSATASTNGGITRPSSNPCARPSATH